jgi:hypothetical protein
VLSVRQASRRWRLQPGPRVRVLRLLRPALLFLRRLRRQMRGQQQARRQQGQEPVQSLGWQQKLRGLVRMPALEPRGQGPGGMLGRFPGQQPPLALMMPPPPWLGSRP